MNARIFFRHYTVASSKKYVVFQIFLATTVVTGGDCDDVTYPSSIVTYSIMTELLIFTLDPILQCLPIVDFLTDTFSDTVTHSPTMQSDPIYKRF